MKPLQHVVESLSSNHPKTTDPAQLELHLKAVVATYEEHWTEKLQRKWAQEKFRAYRLKHKVVDRFLRRLVTESEDARPVHIGYGSAKFPANGKGEVSAPVSFVYKRCALMFKTTLVDEYCTTKMCNNCHEKLVKVVDSTGEDVRGLYWCNSTRCKGKFIARDGNAATNIHKAFEEDLEGRRRPVYLSRESDAGPADRKVFRNLEVSRFRQRSERKKAEAAAIAAVGDDIPARVYDSTTIF